MKNSMTNQQQRFVLYSSADGNIHVDVVLQDENVGSLVSRVVLKYN